MSVIKKNILANFGGSLWTGLMGLIFVPLYIHFMGIEAYGLVGIFATLLALFGLLDMGLSNTLNREMARLSVLENMAQEMRDLVRTLEIPYWSMAFVIGISIAALAPFIADQWLNAESLAPSTVRRAILIMGLVTALQWPLAFYSGGLMGLQQQVLLNGINAMMATFRGLGAVAILWLVSPTVEAFFTWQIAVSASHTGLAAFSLWRSLPRVQHRPRFRRALLISIWRFAAGITGITILATVLMQLDKVILSRMLTLEMFGYYSLANVVAVSLYRVISPVYSAAYPQLTNMVTLGTEEELATLYHKSAQLVSVLVFPAVVVICLFSQEILLLWTRDPVTAERTHLLVSILVIGTALNGTMNIPYALQLASGWTRLAFFVNLVSTIVLVPTIVVLTKLYGAIGAASVWVILNSGYVLVAVQIMHRRLLPDEKWKWYGQDVALPLLAALSVGSLCRFGIPSPSGTCMHVIYLVTISMFILGATALTTPVTRHWACAKVRACRRRIEVLA